MLFKQFTEYVNNGKVAPSETKSSTRKKRSITNDDVTSFLNDMYPGVQQVPTQMVQMLATPQIKPDDKLDSMALYNKQYTKRCEKSQPKCPEEFFRLETNGICIHDPKKGMSFSDSNAYCRDIGDGKAKLFHFENSEETRLLFDYIRKGN